MAYLWALAKSDWLDKSRASVAATGIDAVHTPAGDGPIVVVRLEGGVSAMGLEPGTGGVQTDHRRAAGRGRVIAVRARDRGVGIDGDVELSGDLFVI